MTDVCIILAGGLGTRLKSVLPNRPKCLAPINNSNFLEMQLSMLFKQGIQKFVISLGYLGEMVESELGKLKLPLAEDIKTIHEEYPLGTGGAILNAMEQFKLNECMVTNGDTYLSGSIQEMKDRLLIDNGEIARMAVVEVLNRSRYGGVELKEERVSNFLEKGLSDKGFINAGFYRVHRNVFSEFKPGDNFSFETTVLPKLAKNKELGFASIDGDFIDIGIPSDYKIFCENYGEHK